MIARISMLALMACRAVQATEKERVVESSKEEVVLFNYQESKYVSIAIIVVLLMMTLNNYLESQLKTFKEKYQGIGKYIQSTAMTTFLGIILGTLGLN